MNELLDYVYRKFRSDASLSELADHTRTSPSLFNDFLCALLLKLLFEREDNQYELRQLQSQVEKLTNDLQDK